MKNLKKIITTLALVLTLLSIGLSQNNSLHFDGTDDYVDLGSSVSTGVKTIELWFNPSVTIDNTISDFISLLVRNVYGEVDEFQLAFEFLNPNKGTIRFGRVLSTGNNFIINSNSNLWNANQWYHVAGVFHPVNGLELYINGVKQSDTDSHTGSPGVRPEIAALGRWGDLNIRHFNGKIDDVRFWNTARTQTEIQNNMNTELTGTESGLISYYKMDDTNSSCDIEDCNSNENHGTRIGSGGSNNLPQFSNDVPSITDVACGASTTCFSCPQNTVFNVISGNDWNTVSNWSGGCVPTSPISENITINGNCDLNLASEFIFETNSSLTINSGKTLTVTGTGNMNLKGTTTNNGIFIKSTITNEGTYKGSGTFIGDFINNTTLSPGEN